MDFSASSPLSRYWGRVGRAWSHHEPKPKYVLDENGGPDKNIGNICLWPPYKRYLPPDPQLWRCKRADAFLWERSYRFWCTNDPRWAANTLFILECPPSYFYLDIPWHRSYGVAGNAYRTNNGIVYVITTNAPIEKGASKAKAHICRWLLPCLFETEGGDNVKSQISHTAFIYTSLVCSESVENLTKCVRLRSLCAPYYLLSVMYVHGQDAPKHSI